jgi:DNA replication protein DnaC
MKVEMNLKKKTQLCDKHGKYESTVISSFGERMIFSKCPECQKILDVKIKKEKELYEALELKQKIKNLRSRSGIPIRFEKCSIENYKTHTKEQIRVVKICKTYISNFDTIVADGVCLTFCGKPGTGKTHLACAIANSLIQNKKAVHYVKSYNALQEVKSTYSKDHHLTEKEVIMGFVNAQLLIIDEVGVQYGTDADKIILYQIINGRYEKMMPTIVISNLTQNELTEYLGERSTDRLREGGGVVVPFTWDSYRGKK